jgi:integrase/recombinase XerD
MYGYGVGGIDRRSDSENWAGGLAERSKDNVSDVVRDFLVRCKFRDLQEQTIKDHNRKLGRFVKYCGDCGLGEVCPVIIRGYLDSLKNEYGLDVVTVQRHLVSVKAFFRWAYEEGFIIRNPTVGVRVGGIMKKVVKGLSREELKQLLEAVEDGSSVLKIRHCAIVYILVDCGLRISEVMNLKVSDVDWQSGVLRIRGKGYKERFVRMGLGTRRALKRYMVVRNGNGDGDWLWLNSEGNECQRTVVQIWIRSLGRRLGIKLHAHLLRHTFAISFLRNGGNVFALQAALGHSTLEMTRRYCQALGFEDVFKAHELASPVDNAFKV